MKYRRLIAEMYARDISKDDLAILLGKSRRAISNRINGKTEFTCIEVKTIMNTYFKDCTINFVFAG